MRPSRWCRSVTLHNAPTFCDTRSVEIACAVVALKVHHVLEPGGGEISRSPDALPLLSGYLLYATSKNHP